MKVYNSIQLDAKSIKKAMISYGVSVLRCSQNKKGVLVTVSPKDGNKEKAIMFFNEFKLVRIPNVSPLSVASSDKFIDFGTLYLYEEKHEGY